MIYQFEHEEVTVEDIREVMTVLNAIRYSREEIARKVLPAWAQPYRAIDKAVILSIESLERDLVAISKTETASCEWCEGNVSKYFDVNWYDFTGHERLDKSNYCPACGRKLN